jgi:hypothetical protein
MAGSYVKGVSSKYTHKPFTFYRSGVKAHVMLPGVHRVAALLKRWLLSTHQGAVEASHLQSYLDEFTFRFNRRTSRQRGMVFYRLIQNAVLVGPTSGADLVMDKRPKHAGKHPVPPTVAHSHPASLELPANHRPWRRL